jgi:hypothetical protein
VHHTDASSNVRHCTNILFGGISMNTKVMIAAYRYRRMVAVGQSPVDALVSAVQSVTSTFYEYAEVYNMVKAIL